ncbi:hypothetical protein ACFV0R_04745 [Streptomyces sp. NPDC059578]|uniref:hypothetical protein n=1 Tax=Streptomyces sp. NPDC059578 TaxID=3346874 RepID=UPI0036A889A9
MAWAREARPAGRPLRRETFTAPGDRVLVITWWPADTATGTAVGTDGAPGELPDPPADLVRRPVHRWRFTSVGVE